MIYGETVKNAFAQRLKELFPDVAVYKEKEDETDFFPNFYILLLNVNSDEDRKDHYFHNYFVNIRYRQVADINTEEKLQQKLDKMGVDLITNLVDIPINGKNIKLRSCNFEKIDGVLQFFANVKFQMVKEPEQYAKMRILEEKYNIKS